MLRSAPGSGQQKRYLSELGALPVFFAHSQKLALGNTANSIRGHPWNWTHIWFCWIGYHVYHLPPESKRRSVLFAFILVALKVRFQFESRNGMLARLRRLVGRGYSMKRIGRMSPAEIRTAIARTVSNLQLGTNSQHTLQKISNAQLDAMSLVDLRNTLIELQNQPVPSQTSTSELRSNIKKLDRETLLSKLGVDDDHDSDHSLTDARLRVSLYLATLAALLSDLAPGIFSSSEMAGMTRAQLEVELERRWQFGVTDRDLQSKSHQELDVALRCATGRGGTGVEERNRAYNECRLRWQSNGCWVWNDPATLDAVSCLVGSWVNLESVPGRSSLISASPSTGKTRQHFSLNLCWLECSQNTKTDEETKRILLFYCRWACKYLHFYCQLQHDCSSGSTTSGMSPKFSNRFVFPRSNGAVWWQACQRRHTNPVRPFPVTMWVSLLVHITWVLCVGFSPSLEYIERRSAGFHQRCSRGHVLRRWCHWHPCVFIQITWIWRKKCLEAGFRYRSCDGHNRMISHFLVDATLWEWKAVGHVEVYRFDCGWIRHCVEQNVNFSCLFYLGFVDRSTAWFFRSAPYFLGSTSGFEARIRDSKNLNVFPRGGFEKVKQRKSGFAVLGFLPHNSFQLSEEELLFREIFDLADSEQIMPMGRGPMTYCAPCTSNIAIGSPTLVRGSVCVTEHHICFESTPGLLDKRLVTWKINFDEVIISNRYSIYYLTLVCDFIIWF